MVLAMRRTIGQTGRIPSLGQSAVTARRGFNADAVKTVFDDARFRPCWFSGP